MKSEFIGASRMPVASLSLALVFSAFSFSSAIFMAAYRHPLQPLTFELFCAYAVYALAATLAFFAYCAGERLEKEEGESVRIWALSGLAGALLLPSLLVWLKVGTAGAMAIGAACVAIVFLAFGRDYWGRKAAVWGLFLGAAFAAWAFLIVNAMEYATVLSPENAVAGLLRMDTAFHSAVLAMFGGFGVPSSGLDGVNLMRYHTLMHIWASVLARAAGQNAVMGLTLVHFIVLIPALFFSMATAARRLSAQSAGSEKGLLAAALSIAIVMLMGVWDWRSYLVSETQAFALIFVLLGLPFLKALANDPDSRVKPATLIVGCALCAAAAAAKISCGAVLCVGFGYILARSRKLTAIQYASIALAAGGGVFVLVSIFMPASNVNEVIFYPLHFLRYGAVAIVNLIIIATAVALSAIQWLQGQSRAWNETVVLMMTSAIAPALSLEIGGGSGYYFFNVGGWIACALVAARFADVTPDRMAALLTGMTTAAALLLMAMDVRSTKSISIFLDSLHRLQRAVEGSDVTLARHIFDRAALRNIGERAEALPLARLSRLVSARRDNSAAPIVFISPEARKAMPYSCKAAPLFTPAFIGLPMLMGMPPLSARCDLGTHYGFSDYPAGRSPEIQPPDAVLCAAATQRGFRTVLVAQSFDAIRELRC